MLDKPLNNLTIPAQEYDPKEHIFEETKMSAENSSAPLRYAVDESPPHLLAAGLGLQVVVLVIAGIVLTPTVVLRAAGDPGGFLPWAVFAGLLVSGITTMIQARPRIR